MRKNIVLVFLIIAMTAAIAACSALPAPAPARTEAPAEAAVSPAAEETAEPALPVEPEADTHYEQLIYETLMEGLDGNAYGACAIMGNMHRESRMCPYRYETDGTDGYIYSKDLVGVINKGLENPTDIKRFYFSHYAVNASDSVGFGLCQWTDFGRKNRLYDFAVDQGTRIDDPVMQARFVLYELENFYPEIYEVLRTSNDMEYCCRYFAGSYEKALDYFAGVGSSYRYNAACYYYEMFNPAEAKEQELVPFSPLPTILPEVLNEYS